MLTYVCIIDQKRGGINQIRGYSLSFFDVITLDVGKSLFNEVKS